VKGQRTLVDVVGLGVSALATGLGGTLAVTAKAVFRVEALVRLALVEGGNCQRVESEEGSRCDTHVLAKTVVLRRLVDLVRLVLAADLAHWRERRVLSARDKRREDGRRGKRGERDALSEANSRSPPKPCWEDLRASPSDMLEGSIG
jgi:hypothetical protein